MAARRDQPVAVAACGPNLLNSSLLCNGSNLVADDAHPTPFEHSLVASHISLQMIAKGWL